MAYMCFDCYEVYDDSIKDLQKEWMDHPRCPKASCGNNYVVEVDELLLMAVKILNQKGYITENCCSGHTYESSPNSYIMFNDEVELPSLPKGYKDDLDIHPHTFKEKTNCIRKNFIGESEVEIQKEIFESAREVLIWADSLETLEY